VILMVVGVLGLVIGLFMLASDRRRGGRVVERDREPLY
jgi:hypothetical protein